MITRRLMKVLILTLILSVPILADVFNPSVIPQSTSPSGACSNGSALIHNYVDNTVWGCKAGTWTEIAGGGGGGSSTGPVNAIQAADGSGGFLNTGCTGSSASILCTNGFSTGGPFAAGGLWQACSGVTTPASNNFTLFFDSANSGATSYKNSAGTCAAVGGSSMVYPGAGVSVSTGGAWGTSLTAPVGSTALAGIQTHNIFATDQSITGTLIPYYIADVNSTVFVDLTNHTVQVAPFGTNPTIIPLTVKGSPGQTANLTEYKDSTGAVVASVSATGAATFSAGGNVALLNASNTFSTSQILSSGYFVAAGGFQSYDGSSVMDGGSAFIIRPFIGPSTVPITIKGYASQSANLLNFKDSSNTILSSFDSAGQINAPNYTSTAAAPTVSSGQIGYGGTTVAASNCGGLAAGCIVINVSGTTRYVPYF